MKTTTKRYEECIENLCDYYKNKDQHERESITSTVLLKML